MLTRGKQHTNVFVYIYISCWHALISIFVKTRGASGQDFWDHGRQHEPSKCIHCFLEIIFARYFLKKASNSVIRGCLAYSPLLSLSFSMRVITKPSAHTSWGSTWCFICIKDHYSVAEDIFMWDLSVSGVSSVYCTRWLSHSLSTIAGGQLHVLLSQDDSVLMMNPDMGIICSHRLSWSLWTDLTAGFRMATEAQPVVIWLHRDQL